MEVIVEILNKQIRTTFNSSVVDRQLIDRFQLKLPFLTNSMAVKALVAGKVLPDSWLTEEDPGKYHGGIGRDDKFEQGCDGSHYIIKSIPEDRIQVAADVLTTAWSSLFSTITPAISLSSIDLTNIILQNSYPDVKHEGEILELSGPPDKIMIDGKIYHLNPILDTTGTDIIRATEQEFNSKFKRNQVEMQRALKSYQEGERRKLQEKLASIQSGILVPPISLEVLKNGLQISTNGGYLIADFPFFYRPKQVSENDKTYTIPPRLAFSMSRIVTVRFVLSLKGNGYSTYPIYSCTLISNSESFNHYHRNCWGDHKWGVINIMDDVLKEKQKLEKLLDVIYLNSLMDKKPPGLPSYLKVRRAALKYTEEQLKASGKEPIVKKGWKV